MLAGSPGRRFSSVAMVTEMSMIGRRGTAAGSQKVYYLKQKKQTRKTGLNWCGVVSDTLNCSTCRGQKVTDSHTMTAPSSGSE